jgi:hypothetical protein
VGVRTLVAAGLVLALAGCNETRPPFERSPSNAAIAAALTGLLTADPACRGFAIGSATVWQSPMEIHTNSTSFELKVDADVVATRRAAIGDVAACFGSDAVPPAEWPVGAPGEVLIGGWLGFAGTSWTLTIAHFGSAKAAGSATLQLAPPHAFRLGVNERPGR